MEFRTRSKSCVLDDLIAKLETLPHKHPDWLLLLRMADDLRHDIDLVQNQNRILHSSSGKQLAAGEC